MSFQRQLWVSMGLQGLGAASVLLSVLWLGARCGPEVQGSFSRAKSELEFLAALAMWGLPQALFYFVRSGGLALPVALRLVLRCAALALVVGMVYGVSTGAELSAWVLLGVTLMFCVVQGQLRLLVLAIVDSAWFNVVTALPQVLTLVGVAVVVSRWGTLDVPASAWMTVFAFAYGLAALLAWWALRSAHQASSADRRAHAEPSVSWNALASYGLAAWMTAAFSAAAVVVMQRWVESELGLAALGRFTLAMSLVQVPLLPIGYAAPLLLRRWMEQSGALDSRRWSLRLLGLMLAVAAAVALVATQWGDLGLGLAYEGTTIALAWLLLGAAAEAASRLLTVQASAVGWPWLAVRAELARWAVLALAWMAFKPHDLPMLCAVWSAAAWAAAGVYWWWRKGVVT